MDETVAHINALSEHGELDGEQSMADWFDCMYEFVTFQCITGMDNSLWMRLWLTSMC